MDTSKDFGEKEMKIYFTADCHFSHNNIRIYSNRPFKTVDDMNNAIIKRWNNKVRFDDLVYHLGDFAFKGKSNAEKFENLLNGKIVHIRGNHDMNNGIKSYIDECIMEFGGKVVHISHKPPEIYLDCDFALCGHIHDKWKFKILKGRKGKQLIIINVGVDVWDFTPVSVESILKLYNKLKKGEG